MKKVYICLLAFAIIFESVSNAAVLRNIEVIKERTFPVNIVSDTKEYEESIDLEDIKNPQIIKASIDNGSIRSEIRGNELLFELYGGEKVNSKIKVRKTKTLKIDEMPLSDEKAKTAKIKLDKKALEIQDVSGDFSEAHINNNGEIVVKLRDDAEGTDGFDTERIEEDTVKIEIDKENRNRKINSEWIKTNYPIIGSPIAVSGDTSDVQNILSNEKEIKVVFDNGTPVLNETTKNLGYAYVWVDRDTEGRFRRYNPNSVYKTDRNPISGFGEYISGEEEAGLNITASDDSWTDFVGVLIDGKRYIYILNKDVELESGVAGQVLSDSVIRINEQEFNTEKYEVNFSNAGVSYVPEGKLYSMGELVKGTNGWGEVYPNHSWESKESFFNTISGKYETYVKHFKFFYGPKKKTAFGGYFTYPYSCMLKYKHYKPVKLYSGEITYTYEEEENISGYYYNGWIKIRYTEEKTVEDYPPSSPYNVRYSENRKKLSWESGKDDYTDKSDLSYEIQAYNGEWRNIGKVHNGQTVLDNLIGKDLFRVRTIDDLGQSSKWTESEESSIKLTGEVIPYFIEPGDTISIYAETKSLKDIVKVEAECDEMQMYTELQLTEKNEPTFYEVGFDLDGVYTYEDEYLATSSSKYGTNKSGETEVESFSTKMTTERDNAKIKLPDNISFSKEGTVIFPNQNYLGTPTNFFRYDKKYWFPYLTNQITFKNKKTGKDDVFIEFDNNTAYHKPEKSTTYYFTANPVIRVNTFNYNDKGEPSFEVIKLQTNVGAPITITWNTDVSGITSFNIYSDDKLIGNYKAYWRDVEEVFGNYTYYNIKKYLFKYLPGGHGFFQPTSNRKTHRWARILPDLAINNNPNELPWLGFKLRKAEYISESKKEQYNSNSQTRATNRLLFLNSKLESELIKKYIKIIKETNIPMKRENAIFATAVIEKTCEFEALNILTEEDTIPGNYEIVLTATDTEGETANTRITIVVQDDEMQVYPKEEETVKPKIIEDVKLGRLSYLNNNRYVEELKKPVKINDSEGFICAGETLYVIIKTKGIDYIEIDFEGDKSIKTMDDLTKRFLIDEPALFNKKSDVKIDEYDFPKRVYPSETNFDGEETFIFRYTIPYKTLQTLESWRTLKYTSLEEIDESKLLDRKNAAYRVIIKPNGEDFLKQTIYFDVFERWDTILNRDLSRLIKNTITKWRIEI